jgi:hypothetical protein
MLAQPARLFRGITLKTGCPCCLLKVVPEAMAAAAFMNQFYRKYILKIPGSFIKPGINRLT